MVSRRGFIKNSSITGMALCLRDIRGWFLQKGNNFSFTSNYLKLVLSGDKPRLLSFSTDSLGKGQFQNSPLLNSAKTSAASYSSVIKGHSVYYYSTGKTKISAWEVKCNKNEFSLRTQWEEGQEIDAFFITIAQKLNHCTVLGAMAGEKQVKFPCVLHLPGMGTFRVYCDQPGVNLSYDAYRFDRTNEKGEPYVELQFTGANAAYPDITYRFESVAIYPDLPLVKNDVRFDGLRRNYINIFQLNPRIQCLANNSASDACAFTLFFYAEMRMGFPKSFASERNRSFRSAR